MFTNGYEKDDVRTTIIVRKTEQMETVTDEKCKFLKFW